MRKKFKNVSMVMLNVLCWLLSASSVFAAEKVVKVSSTAGSAEIQEALDQAKDLSGDTLRVEIPDGTHRLDKRLLIFSNTTLKAGANAKMTAAFTETSNGSNGIEGAMLYGAHLQNGEVCRNDESCKHGGYSQIQNIVVEGGVWDRKCNENPRVNASIMNLRHGQNITVKNLEVKNCTNHFINLSGVNGAVVSGVTFRNQVEYAGTDPDFWKEYADDKELRLGSCEVLHFDYMTEKSEKKAYPYDRTVCKNILVENCLFDSVFAGLGTHHDLGLRSTGIIIRDNTFQKVKVRCIDAYGYQNLLITGNKTDGGVHQTFLFANDSAGTASNNRASNLYMFYHGLGKSKIALTSNQISGTNEHAIYLTENCTSEIKSNIIKDSKKMAVYLVEGSSADLIENDLGSSKTDHVVSVEKSKIKASGNTITGAATHGFRLYHALSGCEIKNNKINKVKESGVFLDQCDGTVVVTGNQITSPGKSGIRIRNKGKAKINENTVTSPKEAGIFASDRAVITAEKNTIKKSGSNGIFLNLAGKNCSIKNNKIVSSKNMGILLNQTGNGCKVEDNTIESTGRIGVMVKNTVSCTISGNTIKKSKVMGIQTGGEKKKPCTATIKDNRVNTQAGGKKDIYLASYSKNCRLSGNELGTLGFTAAKDATYKDLDGSTGKVEEEKKFTSGNLKYEVVKSQKTAAVVSGKDSSLASVKIPATVKNAGYTYEVVEIKANAFKDCEKLKSAEIGKNVAAIRANAFFGCKNLKKLEIRSTKLETVGGKAFKGIYAKAQIKVPQKFYSKYKKLLTGKGQSAKVKIVK